MMKLTAGLLAAGIALLPGATIFGIAAVALPAAEASCWVESPPGGGGGSIAPKPPSESGSVVFPLPAGTWIRTDPFGPRDFAANPFHTGADYAAPDGTAILAAADGYVTRAEFSAEWGGLIVIEHTVAGQLVATAYAHSWQHGIYVAAGQTVKAGDHIGDVGSSGLSTGAHLHFEVRPGGTNGAPVDPEPWLASNGAIDLNNPGGGPATQPGCATDDEGASTAEDDDATQEKDAAKEEAP